MAMAQTRKQMAGAPLVTLALLLGLASAQVSWPMVGQNIAPAGVITVVVVDYLVDSIEGINSETNSWTGHVWFHMQWEDTRAFEAIQNATNQWLNGGTCSKPCDWTNHKSAGCCDLLFIPHIDIPNIVAIKQESFPMYRFWLKGSDPKVVHWSERISADFHSPFDFRAWPFEHQHLLVELQIPPSIADRVTLVFGEATHLRNTPHTKGEVVTGWHIKSITRRMYDPSGCYNVTKANSTFFSITPNGSAAVLTNLAFNKWAQLYQSDSKVDVFSTLDTVECQLVGTTNTAEGLAQYGPRYLVIDTMVQRAKNDDCLLHKDQDKLRHTKKRYLPVLGQFDEMYYVLANLTPLVLLAYMVFVTYAMERSDLEARMGVIVTLVLAVSALQFTYNFPPASYINTVQQITLMSYVLYFIIAVESMITAQICRMHTRRRQHDQLVSVAQSAPSLNTFNSTGSTSLNVKVPTTVLEDPMEDPSINITTKRSVPLIVRPVKGTPVQEATAHRTSSGGTAATPVAQDNGNVYVQRVGPGPVAEGWVCCGAEGGDVEQPRPTSFGEEPMERASSSEMLRHTLASGHPSSSSSITITCTSSDFTSSSGVELKQRATPIKLAVPDSSVPPSPSSGEGGGGTLPTGRKSRWYPLTSGIMGGAKNGNTFSRAMSMHMNAMAGRTSAMRERITKDEAYAQLFASRMDNIFCWSLLVSYTVTLAVLLYINSQVGDHKMMLAGSSAPANM